jgi:hypothetical protein
MKGAVLVFQRSAAFLMRCGMVCSDVAFDGDRELHRCSAILPAEELQRQAGKASQISEFGRWGHDHCWLRNQGMTVSNDLGSLPTFPVELTSLKRI